MAKELRNLLSLELLETALKIRVSFLEASDRMGKHTRRVIKVQLFQTRVLSLLRTVSAGCIPRQG